MTGCLKSCASGRSSTQEMRAEVIRRLPEMGRDSVPGARAIVVGPDETTPELYAAV